MRDASPPRRRRSRSRSPRRDRDRDARPRSRWEEDDDASRRRHDGGRGRRRDEDDDDRGRAATTTTFGLSGALAADTNTRNGVQLLHAPPPDAAAPPALPGWRLYTFKGDAPVGDPLKLAGPAAATLLFGRERRVADVPTDHPSCSKQHAVLQFRRTRKDGEESSSVRPYIIDLGSTNGTHLNGAAIEAQRYVELRSGDVVRCGHSGREYVLVRE